MPLGIEGIRVRGGLSWAQSTEGWRKGISEADKITMRCGFINTQITKEKELQHMKIVSRMVQSGRITMYEE
jgi:hypothetical protein